MASGGQFRGDPPFGERDAVVTREGTFILVREGRLHPLAFSGHDLGNVLIGTGNDQQIPAINCSRPDQSRMTEPQDQRVSVIVAGHIRDPLATACHRIGTEPHHPERHSRPRMIVGTQVRNPPGADERVHVLPQWTGWNAGLGGLRQQDGRNRREQHKSPETGCHYSLNSSTCVVHVLALGVITELESLSCTIICVSANQFGPTAKTGAVFESVFSDQPAAYQGRVKTDQPRLAFSI